MKKREMLCFYNFEMDKEATTLWCPFELYWLLRRVEEVPDIYATEGLSFHSFQFLMSSRDYVKFSHSEKQGKRCSPKETEIEWWTREREREREKRKRDFEFIKTFDFHFGQVVWLFKLALICAVHSEIKNFILKVHANKSLSSFTL